MKKRILWVVFFALSGCCTKRLCLCPEPKIEVYTSQLRDGYFVVRTDKKFAKVDSTFINFYQYGERYLYELTEDSFFLGSNILISDFNYIIKNFTYHTRDTIYGVSYDLRPYSFECNNCFLKKDIMFCEDIIDKKLIYNGEVINDFKITLN